MAHDCGGRWSGARFALTKIRPCVCYRSELLDINNSSYEIELQMSLGASARSRTLPRQWCYDVIVFSQQ